MKEILRRYIKKNPFPRYQYIRKMMEKKDGEDVYFPEVYYEVIMRIYENLDNDSKVMRLSGLMHEHGGIEKLSMILYVITELLGRSKNYNIATYGRRIEFMYQELDEEWQA